MGDVLLVPLKGGGYWGDMFGGAAGAAWATVASQYAALIFFAARLWSIKPTDDNAAAAAATANNDSTTDGTAWWAKLSFRKLNRYSKVDGIERSKFTTPTTTATAITTATSTRGVLSDSKLTH